MAFNTKSWVALVTLGVCLPTFAVEYKNQGTWEKTIQELRRGFQVENEGKSFKAFVSPLVKKEHRDVAFDMDVSGITRLILTARAPGGNGSAHAVWGDLYLEYPDGSKKSLTSAKILSSNVGWGQLRVNRDENGRALQVGSRKISNGFWAHADSRIVIELDGKATRLTGFCGINNSGGGNGIIFTIDSAELDSVIGRLENDFTVEVSLLKQYNEALLKKIIANYSDEEIIQQLLNDLGPCSETAKAYQQLLDNKVDKKDTQWVKLSYAAIEEYVEITDALKQAKKINIDALKRAIVDLTKSNPGNYDGETYLKELEQYQNELPELLQTVSKISNFNNGPWISCGASFSTSALNNGHSGNKARLLDEENPHDWAFHSIDDAKNPWVTIDLGREREIGSLDIINRPGFESRAKNLVVSVSSDNQTWKEVWKNTGNGRQNWNIKLSNPETARYVKIWLNINRGIFHLRNVKIYAPKIGATTITSEEQRIAEAKTKIRKLVKLRRKALIANPLLADFDKIIAVVRNDGQKCLPSNWAGNTSLWGSALNVDNQIVAIDFKNAAAPYKTIYKPTDRNFVGEVDLHFDGSKFLFSMPKRSKSGNSVWHLWEQQIDKDGNAKGELRQVTDDSVTDYDCYDPCYLPNGKIIFNATVGYQGVPCVNGGDYVGNLCIMEANGTGMRRLTYDQDNNWDPVVMNNGMIMYHRWEYTDSAHYFSRMLFDMYPDGREQRALYGSNSYWPNTLFYARPVPGSNSKFVAIVSGHHGVNREGELLLFDTELGRQEDKGVVQRIPGYGKKVEPVVMDNYMNGRWPRFVHPYPLSDKYFLVSCQPSPSEKWGIYLVDIFDNMLLIKELPGKVVFEPTPLKARKTPPIIPDAINLKSNEATVYISDVYEGPGLAGVPKGTVKELVIYAYEYAFRNTGNHDAVGFEGPWDVRKVIGTVPVYEDGSASFKIPANVPVAVLPLDAHGNAMQLFRSWFVGVPGEVVSCVGCHENRDTPPPIRSTKAYLIEPVTPKPFKGPYRGFSFDREIQPILDKYCVGCHRSDAEKDYHLTNKAKPNFSPKRPWVKYWRGWPGGLNNYSASYVELMPYVRRNGPEGVWYVLNPLEFHFGATQLGQLLRKGHHGVKLDRDSWERLSMWVNMNLPCIGRWAEFEPNKVKRDKIDRIRELRKKYAGVETTSEDLIVIDPPKNEFVKPAPVARPKAVAKLAGWPMTAEVAKKKQQALGRITASMMGIELVKIPAGSFLMGNSKGSPDENALHKVTIAKSFWMGKTEITLAQYRQFQAEYKNGYYDRHWKDQVNPGYVLDDNVNYPVIRISYDDAQAFCQWLSTKTGKKVRLPTEAEWEWACRAGSDQDFFFGDLTKDGVKFGKYANLADAKIREMAVTGVNPQPVWRVNENNYAKLPYSKSGDNFFDYEPYDTRDFDGVLMLAPVGKYQANPWGLQDMHGNVAEWTSTPYAPYGKKVNRKPGFQEMYGNVVRGGSWYDRPYRATAGYRLAYPKWQKPFNVGFRIVVED